MYRGTTPTIEIEFDFDINLISCMYATFVQNNTRVFEKTMSDCQYNGNVATITLTQAETLKLRPNEMVYMQVRVKLADGNALTSAPIKFNVLDIYKEGVI